MRGNAEEVGATSREQLLALIQRRGAAQRVLTLFTPQATALVRNVSATTSSSTVLSLLRAAVERRLPEWTQSVTQERDAKRQRVSSSSKSDVVFAAKMAQSLVKIYAVTSGAAAKAEELEDLVAAMNLACVALYVVCALEHAVRLGDLVVDNLLYQVAKKYAEMPEMREAASCVAACVHVRLWNSHSKLSNGASEKSQLMQLLDRHGESNVALASEMENTHDDGNSMDGGERATFLLWASSALLANAGSDAAISIETDSDTPTQEALVVQLEQLAAGSRTLQKQAPQEYLARMVQGIAKTVQQLPDNWIIVSLMIGLSSELVVTRFPTNGSAPISFCLPTVAWSKCIREMDAIIQDSREILSGHTAEETSSWNSEQKKNWWNTRKLLDKRVEEAVVSMQEALGFWRCLLVGGSTFESQIVQRCWSLLTKSKTGPIKLAERNQMLLCAIADAHQYLSDSEVVDGLKHIAAEIEVPLPESVSREALQVLRTNLKSTQNQLEPILEGGATTYGWEGIVGEVPDPDELRNYLLAADLYIYCGHGSGEAYLHRDKVLSLQSNCSAALLFGCSSGRLEREGIFGPSGAVLAYLRAGSPAVLAMLWDVTDRDIDQLSVKVLHEWLLADNESDSPSLAQVLQSSRSVCKLKYLNGHAAVCYGLPLYVAKS
ncbi:hypothetical protein JG687_00002117 [Phytophthora cactorum]|uniref:separase n=1 Tax=Phytophthora cactorum TaxID=29920 RepID=A0A8T1UXV4_9STRA|nr:hypothetical protein JG687_00002117 [Phytophthora cactorum]